MILSYAYTHHRGALRASLRNAYGIDLRDPQMSLTDLAEHVMWLPAGSALWLAVGGPAALTVAEEQQRWIDYRLRMLAWLQTADGSKGRNRPEPPKPIKFRSELAAESAAISAKGDAWSRRQAMRHRTV